MSFIETKQYDYDSYLYYKLVHCNNRKDAFEWFAKTVNIGLDNIKSIRLDDLKSFHDGTISTTCEQIVDVDAFVTKYSNLPFKKLSVIFLYDSINLILKLNLDDFIISLACPKGYESAARLLAQKLNLE